MSLSIVQNDPVADVIALLRPETVISARIEAHGPTALSFDGYPHIKLGTVVAGACWILLGKRRVRLETGDFYLLRNPAPYVMTTAPTLRPRPFAPLYRAATSDVIRIGRGTPRLEIVGGHFQLDPRNAPLLLEVLPSVVHAAHGDPRTRPIASLAALLADEASATHAGRSLVLDRLAQVLLVHAVRLGGERVAAPSWLRGLRDPQIGAALRRMHGDVARAWRLEDLAAGAGMSRSAFAQRFKALVGAAPHEYLVRWRLALARDALADPQRTVSEIAFAVGYRSESAFSRVIGVSPRTYRQGR